MEKGTNPSLKSYRSDLETAPIEDILSVFTPEKCLYMLLSPSTSPVEKNSKSWPDGIIH